MKVVAAIINRNLPDLADELFYQIKDLVPEVYFIENGSDPDRISKNANICFSESNGISWAVNFAIQKAIDDGYDAIWINYNDVRFDDYKAYLDWSIEKFNQDERIAVTTGYWGDIWNCGKPSRKNPYASTSQIGINQDPPPGIDFAVSHFSAISFIVTTHAAKKISEAEERLAPFWDNSNYTGHLNMLAPGMTLYELGMYMISSTSHLMTETYEGKEDEETLALARGVSDAEWQNEKGPKDMDAWLARYFPKLSDKHHDRRSKRDAVIKDISNFYRNNIIL